MKYYEYRQNNSGGSFTEPAISVFIEADTPEEADSIAIENGLYFGGEGDCECCGDRWYTASEYDAIITGYPEASDNAKWWAERSGVPAMHVIKK